MRRALFVIALLAAAPPAAAQQPSAGYTVTVESPGSVVLGNVTLRVRASGGVREAEFAAYHLRTAGGWSEAQSVKLSRVGENLFEQGLDTSVLPNDAYRIEIRVWSEVPPYDPTDPRTYARAVVDMSVDNPPPTPTRLAAVSPATSLRVGWEAVPTADRSDFEGYHILLRKGKTCPADMAAYRDVATVAGLVYVDEEVAPGDYCVRVAAARKSAVSEVILSAPSTAARVELSRGNDPAVQGGGFLFFDAMEQAEPPPPPRLGDGEAIISDGEFGEDLPYGPQTVTQQARGTTTETAMTREAGVDPRRTPTLIASGLILATLAGLLRRFLTGVPSRP